MPSPPQPQSAPPPPLITLEPEILDDAPEVMLNEPDTDQFIIQARGLTKQYGDLTALNELNLDVPRGSVFGIIGPNGAGKSTMFSIFATLLKPTRGAARVCGADPTRQPKTVRKNMGYMPDVMGVYERLTVKEYLEFHAAAYKVPRNDWADLVGGLLELVDLDVKSNSLVDDLSRGMKQRLSLARAMVHDPELLILDEPASGLDPRARIEFRQLLNALQDMGKSILISSHILSELQQMCSEIAVIEAGRLLAAGSPDAILDQLGAGRRVRVRYADQTIEDFAVSDTTEQQQLLKKLVAEDRPIVEFRELSNDLEDLFLQITQGIVQ